MAHFIKAGRDKPRQADHIDLLFNRFGNDVGGRHHDAHIDNIEIIALQHDADNILANIMHIALHRCHQHLAIIARHGFGARCLHFGLFSLHKRLKIGDSAFHHARGFHHLRQEHFTLAKQITDRVHAVHQRAFNHIERARQFEARLFRVVFNKIGNAIDQRMRQPCFHRLFAPSRILFFRCTFLPAKFLGNFKQLVRAIRPPIQKYIFNRLF